MESTINQIEKKARQLSSMVSKLNLTPDVKIQIMSMINSFPKNAVEYFAKGDFGYITEASRKVLNIK